MREWDYRVTACIRIVDGDTFDLTLHKRMDFGFYLHEDKYWSSRFRLLGLDTWETNQAGGAAATQFAREWIEAAIFHDVLRGQTFKADNFGRWLIVLYRVDTGETLAAALRAAGHEKVKTP